MNQSIQTFLLGVLAVMSAVAASFFFRFWKQTRDSLFLSFAISFGFASLEQTARLFLEHPNEGSPWIYMIRLFTYLLILAAIYKKNFGRD